MIVFAVYQSTYISLTLSVDQSIHLTLTLSASVGLVSTSYVRCQCRIAWPDGYIFLNGPNPSSFCLFSFFSHDKYSTITINEKSIDGLLGTRTWGGRMVGADKYTELWLFYLCNILLFTTMNICQRDEIFSVVGLVTLMSNSPENFVKRDKHFARARAENYFETLRKIRPNFFPPLLLLLLNGFWHSSLATFARRRFTLSILSKECRTKVNLPFLR